MVRRVLLASILTLGLAWAAAIPLAPSAGPSEVACGDEETQEPEDSNGLQRFACGDEKEDGEPEDSTPRLS